jgi:hypothetical protein
MNDKEIIKSMGYPSLEYKIMFEAMQKARQDERKKLEAENLKLHMKIGFLEGQIDFLKGKDSELKEKKRAAKSLDLRRVLEKVPTLTLPRRKRERQSPKSKRSVGRDEMYKMWT